MSSLIQKPKELYLIWYILPIRNKGKSIRMKVMRLMLAVIHFKMCTKIVWLISLKQLSREKGGSIWTSIFDYCDGFISRNVMKIEFSRMKCIFMRKNKSISTTHSNVMPTIFVSAAIMFRKQGKHTSKKNR